MHVLFKVYHGNVYNNTIRIIIICLVTMVTQLNNSYDNVLTACIVMVVKIGADCHFNTESYGNFVACFFF